MRIFKIALSCLVVGWLGCSAAFAYSSDWWSLSAGAGTGESQNYRMIVDLVGGGVVVGNSAGAVDTNIGFLAGLLQFGGDVDNPVITNFKINGKEVGSKVKAGDYIDSGAVTTAAVTDDTGINQASSQVGADSATVAFNSASSIYNAATGALEYSFSGPPLADGDHTLKILAVDTTGNTTSSAIAVKVESDLKAVNPLTHPTPYNPDKGDLQIGYMLTRSSDQPVNIWIFNSFNQLVYRRTIPVGGEGTLAGYNVVNWNGVDNFNKKVSPQLLILKISAGKDMLATVKAAVLR